jgi:hypothetical protein
MMKQERRNRNPTCLMCLLYKHENNYHLLDYPCISHHICRSCCHFKTNWNVDSLEYHEITLQITVTDLNRKKDSHKYDRFAQCNQNSDFIYILIFTMWEIRFSKWCWWKFTSSGIWNHVISVNSYRCFREACCHHPLGTGNPKCLLLSRHFICNTFPKYISDKETMSSRAL